MDHHHINYIELASSDLARTEQFFSQVFGWDFEYYGADYCAFDGSGVKGGFYRADLVANSKQGSALVVIYSHDLEQTLSDVEQAGGTIHQGIFTFPGGRRFHFIEPSGNEFAVWSDRG